MSNLLQKSEILKISHYLDPKCFDTKFNCNFKKNFVEYLANKYDSDNFFLINTKKLKYLIELWKLNLPNIEPYYAVKSNPDEMIIKLLSQNNVNFDCASKGEIELVKSITSLRDIIYANPCKEKKSIEYAVKNKITKTTFDSIGELTKMESVKDDIELVLRLKVDDSGSEVKFSEKFGCEKKEIEDIIKYCSENKFNLIGFSFHVGSRCKNKGMFRGALEMCKYALDISKKYNFNPYLIDIGGGFPNNNEELFLNLCVEIKDSISDIFKNDKLKFIAEPGRFFSGPTHSLVCKVINKKKYDDCIIYYINDSIYQSFGFKVFGGEKPQMKFLDIKDEETKYNSCIFGQSCDGIDLIYKNENLPELEIGTKIIVNNFGAYSRASGSGFNGFKLGKLFYLI